MADYSIISGSMVDGAVFIDSGNGVEFSAMGSIVFEEAAAAPATVVYDIPFAAVEFENDGEIAEISWLGMVEAKEAAAGETYIATIAQVL